ncbi:MAG TPA: hypothetical protein VD866_05775 [Urbifossiella sp.]|nr:hypothetical protein [Urbifossiella sp.]
MCRPGRSGGSTIAVQPARPAVFVPEAPLYRAATTFLSLAVVTGLFAYDLVGEYSFAVARPLTLAALAVAAVLFVTDAIVSTGEPVESS